RERRDRRPGDERGGGGARGVHRTDGGEAHGGLRLAHAARGRGHTRRALPTPRLEFLALCGPRRSEAEAVDDKGVVVLLLALLIGPVVGAHPRLDDELIALARVAGDRLTERAEGDEPQRGDDLTRRRAQARVWLPRASDGETGNVIRRSAQRRDGRGVPRRAQRLDGGTAALFAHRAGGGPARAPGNTAAGAARGAARHTRRGARLRQGAGAGRAAVR